MEDTKNQPQTSELRIGAHVRMSLPGAKREEGTIYAFLPGNPHPWYVRPLDYSKDIPGIACTAEELEVLPDEPQIDEVRLARWEEEQYARKHGGS